MKKILILIIASIFTISCNKNTYPIKNDCYTVLKIKRNRACYEIYAQKGDFQYKIISEVKKSDTGTKIALGGCYNFDLKSDSDIFKETFGVGMIPNHRQVYIYPRNTIIRTAGSYIYFASNLKGLYFQGK